MINPACCRTYACPPNSRLACTPQRLSYVPLFYDGTASTSATALNGVHNRGGAFWRCDRSAAAGGGSALRVRADGAQGDGFGALSRARPEHAAR